MVSADRRQRIGICPDCKKMMDVSDGVPVALPSAPTNERKIGDAERCNTCQREREAWPRR
jgi:uncharacterized protein YbaR (Trm112 family)